MHVACVTRRVSVPCCSAERGDDAGWVLVPPPKPQRLVDAEREVALPSDEYDDAYVPSSVRSRVMVLEGGEAAERESELITASVDARRGVVTSPSVDDELLRSSERKQAFIELASQLDALNDEQPRGQPSQHLGTRPLTAPALTVLHKRTVYWVFRADCGGVFVSPLLSVLPRHCASTRLAVALKFNLYEWNIHKFNCSLSNLPLYL